MHFYATRFIFAALSFFQGCFCRCIAADVLLIIRLVFGQDCLVH